MRPTEQIPNQIQCYVCDENTEDHSMLLVCWFDDVALYQCDKCQRLWTQRIDEHWRSQATKAWYQDGTMVH